MSEKHHIIFRSQGGLNFPLNLIELTVEQHRGNGSPHLNRARDLELKRQLQLSLTKILSNKYYTAEELIKELELKHIEAYKMVKHLYQCNGKYKTEDVIKRLLGGRFYI